MAIVQNFTLLDSSTLANFKAWAQAISNAMATFGWVQSSDTGQVNWSTLSGVPSYSAPVYEIWMMGDNLQSTFPVYLKLSYGPNNNSGVELYAITGTGSNGSGTLTGASISIANYVANSLGLANVYESDISGSTNRLHFTLWRGAVSFFFSIERSHDANGNDTASYATVIYTGSQGQFIQNTWMLQANGGVLPPETGGVTFQTTGTSGALSQSVAVVPFYPLVGKVDYPMLGCLCIKKNDFADGAQFKASLYGASHNYMSIKSNTSTVGRNQTANNAVAMRFE